MYHFILSRYINSIFKITRLISNISDFVNLFDKFSLFIFGSGLYRISKFYNTDIRKESERFTHEMLTNMFRVTSWIYGIIAVDIALASLSLAITLPSYASDVFHELFFKHVTSHHISLAAVGFIIGGSVLIQNKCRTSADREIDTYRKEHGINKQTQPNRKQDYQDKESAKLVSVHIET